MRSVPPCFCAAAGSVAARAIAAIATPPVSSLQAFLPIVSSHRWFVWPLPALASIPTATEGRDRSAGRTFARRQIEPGMAGTVARLEGGDLRLPRPRQLELVET